MEAPGASVSNATFVDEVLAFAVVPHPARPPPVAKLQTRSQSSGSPGEVLSVTAGEAPGASASSSKTPRSWTACAPVVRKSATSATTNTGPSRKQRLRLLPVGPRMRSIIPSLLPMSSCMTAYQQAADTPPAVSCRQLHSTAPFRNGGHAYAETP